MIELRNPATGHVVRTDDASVDFWSAAGYRPEVKKAAATKAAVKKSSSTKK